MKTRVKLNTYPSKTPYWLNIFVKKLAIRGRLILFNWIKYFHLNTNYILWTVIIYHKTMTKCNTHPGVSMWLWPTNMTKVCLLSYSLAHVCSPITEHFVSLFDHTSNDTYLKYCHKGLYYAWYRLEKLHTLSACKQIYVLFIFRELKSYQKSRVYSWSMSCLHHVTIVCPGKLMWPDRSSVLIGQVLQIIQSDQGSMIDRVNVTSFSVQPCTPNSKQHS